MARQRSFSTKALLIKRSDIGEADRIVTLLSASEGKIVCIAKGVRKLTSSKRALLEPGDIVQAFFVNTKSMPLLTQARLINSASPLRESLAKIRQLTQLLEIIDKLCAEGEIDDQVFAQALILRSHLLSGSSHTMITKELGNLLVMLGYSHPSETAYKNILDYVESLSERKMKSFDYLKVT